MIEDIVKYSDVADILEKALDGKRLDFADGERLYQSRDFNAIGAAANEIRGRMNGNKAYYVVNRHINYTDICKNQCKFCAYSRRPEDGEGYVMTVEEIIDRADEYYDDLKFTELHIVGGCHPELELEYYTRMLSSLKQRYPSVHLQAFTAVEIAHIAQVSNISVHDALVALRDAGLGSIPGGGAEVFNLGVRNEICPEKLPGSEWLAVMREAHSLGIRSNATMLFGHVESYADRIEHMLALRELQDETGGFMAFIPLKFHPANTRLSYINGEMSAADALKVYSISRLFLDNIAHIKVFWIMLGMKLAQLALSYGVDDFDGTVVEERITHRAGASTPEGLTVSEIRSLIEETGATPVERDTVYNEVGRFESQKVGRSEGWKVGAETSSA